MEDLHDLVLKNILPRVPTKSVCRFKCVSKQWHSFLTSDIFKTLHSRHVDQQKNNLKLLVLYKTKRSFKFTTVDCEEDDDQQQLVPRRSKGLSLTHRPLPQFRGIPHRPLNIHILTSCHGLVCLGMIKDDDEYADDDDDDEGYSHLTLWNPLTNEYKRLSKSNSHMELYPLNSYGMYYSSCEDDYKLVCVNLDDFNFYLYSLKSDSWRRLDAFQSKQTLYHGTWSRQATYLNQNLYFLQQDPNPLVQSSSLIRFDTITERLSKIDIPNLDPRSYSNFATIIVISGCIHVCVKYECNFSRVVCLRMSTCFKLWKLDEYDNMKQMLTYQLKPLYGDTVTYLHPFHLMKNGNWLMLKDSWERNYNNRIYKVDLKKKTHITNKGKEKEEDNIIFDDIQVVRVRMYNFANRDNLPGEVRYIETFVSPNRFKK